MVTSRKIATASAGIVGALFLAGTVYADEPRILKELSPDGGSACFGRVYDASHLKAHPHQKVARIFFYHGRDPVSRPSEDPYDGVGSAGYNGFMATTARGAPKPEWVGGWCNASGEGGDKSSIHCGMECDRTMAELSLDAAGRLKVDAFDRDIYLDIGAEDELGKVEYERQALGTDDNGFLLERRPVADCKAEFARIDPVNPALGDPLRVRLKPDQPFCFGRDYSAEHLASHPDQLTQTIRVFRSKTELASFAAKGTISDWPNGADLVVTMISRKGAAKATQTYSCQGEADQWRCAAIAAPDGTSCDLSEKEIYLRRGANGTMMLANPKDSLPLTDLCQANGQTKSDDRVFRLEAMPQSACAR
ncbi:hypothetical protein [Mesorhizobium sp. 1M-11]|uniref:hypothetical protein n=1 Tax=Mesorhizobium sp. 1M-11 TaxID=1529006 RepID=UPI0006C771A8|nr:hypothetical protein [Mesorhizobium sp. 1M-11]